MSTSKWVPCWAVPSRYQQYPWLGENPYTLRLILKMLLWSDWYLNHNQKRINLTYLTSLACTFCYRIGTRSIIIYVYLKNWVDKKYHLFSHFLIFCFMYLDFQATNVRNTVYLFHWLFYLLFYFSFDGMYYRIYENQYKKLKYPFPNFKIGK